MTPPCFWRSEKNLVGNLKEKMEISKNEIFEFFEKFSYGPPLHFSGKKWKISYGPPL